MDLLEDVGKASLEEIWVDWSQMACGKYQSLPQAPSDLELEISNRRLCRPGLKHHFDEVLKKLAEERRGGNARPIALAAKSAKKFGALVKSIKPDDTGRIWPDHLHTDQVHAQDPEIASSSGSVEPQIASDCLTLNSTMSQPSSAPHFSLQKMSDEADVRIEILEVDNHTHLMQDVGSHTNIASARPSSGNYVSAHDLQPSSSAMAQEKALSPHFNRCGTSNEADVRIIIDNQDDNHRHSVECLQSRVASSGVTSSSGVCASVHGRRHTHDPGADATSEISDHNSEMSDHGADDPIGIGLEVFARSLSALNWQPSSSAMAHDMPLCPHPYGTSNEADVSNQDDFQSHVASSGVTSSSGVCASVHDRLLQSSNGADARAEIRDHGNDNTSVHGRRLQLNEPESLNGADARSEMRDHGNDNAAQRMRTDFQSDTRDPGADARSEISDHVGEMSDHGGDDPIEIRLEVSDHGDDDDPIETRPEESDHVIVDQVGGQADVGGQLNAIVAQVGGQAVVNLMASHSPDSPFLRLFAVFAGCSFVGGLYANSRLKNQKVAEYLTKFSAICILFAVSIALGVNVLEGTKWHLNIVVTVALCIVSVALVARADLGPPTAPASNQSRTSQQT